MPSPFPGMDPYLEGSLWMSVHAQLCVGLRPAVEPADPPTLHRPARRGDSSSRSPGRRGSRSGRSIPDVAVVRSAAGRTGPRRPSGPSPRRSAWRRVMRDSGACTSRSRSAIVEHRRLVAAIEILSPTNKRREGRRRISREARSLPATATPICSRSTCSARAGACRWRRCCPPAPYFVFLSRADQTAGDRRLADRLWISPCPTVPVPLLAGDADAMLDLSRP